MTTNINENNRELLRMVNEFGAYIWELNFYSEDEGFNNLTPSKIKTLKEKQREMRQEILKIN